MQRAPLLALAPLLAHAAATKAKEEHITLGPMTDSTATWLVLIPTFIGLVWALKEMYAVRSIKIVGPPSSGPSAPLRRSQEDVQRTLEQMMEIAKHIQEGSSAFLKKEYEYCAVYIVVFSAIIAYTINIPTMIAFVAGSVTSIVCGYIGMKTAVFCNVRTTHEAWISLPRAFDCAVRGGSVMGFALVSLGVLDLMLLILWFWSDSFQTQFPDMKTVTDLCEALAGYGLGGSSIALFGRVGGGIYTKAADVGADLSGKNEYGMDEDDPRNPACIADNVGDNVGDIAGMGADLFGSFAESTCAAMVIAGASHSVKNGIADNWPALLFPLLLSSTGIIVGLVTMIFVTNAFPVKTITQIEQVLKYILVISTVLETPVILYLAHACLPSSFNLSADVVDVTPMKCAVAVLCGLWSGLVIGFVTEYYTSHSYEPVREVAESHRVSAATGIIMGLALGYASNVVPVFCLAITVGIAHSLAGMYGVALGALGMLGTLTLGLTIDAYGPISDNAGGIAEMSHLGEDVRKLTDALDAAGNTTAAIGKGFAIGSAALVSLALFGAFTVRANITIVNVLDPTTFTGLLLGALLPYAFSAMTMKSVGKAANQMVAECMRQFPKIVNEGAKPEYQRCIEISTEASLKEMIAPGALVILSPLVLGVTLGKNATAGLLSGSLVSGVQLAISMSNTGGAWDNAKKYIEAGGLGPDHKKGSAAHKNAVTGDTVGDPLKDTSGPSLNIVVKLSAIMSLVFGALIDSYSTESGSSLLMKNLMNQ